jgi:hypothetical protein
LYNIISKEASTSTGMKPNPRVLIEMKGQESIAKDDSNLEKHRSEDSKSEERLSQSTISGKPSPFIVSQNEFALLNQKKQRIIRNKSYDEFCSDTLFLENRYINALKHNKL